MYAAQTKHTLENLGITRKYKGYYFLSDAVEIVNIKETALLNVGKYIYSPYPLNIIATAGRLKGISAPLF